MNKTYINLFVSCERHV